MRPSAHAAPPTPHQPLPRVDDLRQHRQLAPARLHAARSARVQLGQRIQRLAQPRARRVVVPALARARSRRVRALGNSKDEEIGLEQSSTTCWLQHRLLHTEKIAEA